MRLSRYGSGGILWSVVLLLISLFVNILVFTQAGYAQQSYGQGVYGECAYGQLCQNPAPTTVVPVPPSSESPQSGRAFSVNITEGQVFRGESYEVVVTPNFPLSQIERVVLLKDGEVVGEAHTTDGESYIILWQISAEGQYTLSIVIHLRDGAVMQRDFAVRAEAEKMADGAEDQEPNEGVVAEIEDTNRNRSLPARAAAAVGALITQAVQATPKAVAYTIPYFFLSLLAGLAGLLLLQARNQFAHSVALLKLLKKDKALADEKTTFIMLVSHHLRTPLTILRNSLDLVAGDAPSKDMKIAQEGVKTLQQKSEQILKNVLQNKHLKDIEVPNMSQARQKLYYSWKIIVPALLSIVILVLLNGIYIAAGKTAIVVPNILAQSILVIIVTMTGYVALQRYSQRQKERSHIDQQRRYEEELDKARNKFILRVAKEITPIVATTKAACHALGLKEAESRGVEEAFSRLDTMLSRFVLAAELERGKLAANAVNVDVKPLIEGVIASQQTQKEAKKLTIKQKLDPVTVKTNELLLRYVLTALYDNAIRYAKEGTTVEAAANRGTYEHVFILENQGKGIPPERLESLFKPFSTSGDVEVFDNQGMGLNLYLSQLIMGYLGGKITLQSEPDVKTTAKVSLAA